MAQEPTQPSTPGVPRSPRYLLRLWVEVLVASVAFDIFLGGQFVFAFSPLPPQFELTSGLALLSVELTLVTVLIAVGWPDQAKAHPFLAFQFGWVAWNVVCGTLLAMFVLDTSPQRSLWDPSPQPPLLPMFLLIVTPTVASFAVAMLTGTVRRQIVAWRTRRGGPAQ